MALRHWWDKMIYSVPLFIERVSLLPSFIKNAVADTPPSLTFNINTRNYWNDKLSSYGTFWRNEHYVHIADLLPKDGAFSLLDIGCALGDGCELLQHKFPNITLTGVDISDVGIKKAKRKNKYITYLVLDITTDPIPGVYDYITMVETLEHFSDIYKIVDKCLRQVRRSVIISTPYNAHTIGAKVSMFKKEHRSSFNKRTFASYNCKRIAITDYIESTKSKCIIYEISP